MRIWPSKRSNRLKFGKKPFGIYVQSREVNFTLPLAGGSDAVAAGEGRSNWPSPALRGRLSQRESEIPKLFPNASQKSQWPT
jgi:hypothetical protein